jgi:hypothetical protein
LSCLDLGIPPDRLQLEVRNASHAVGTVLRFTGADAWHGRVALGVRRHLLAAGWVPGRPGYGDVRLSA